MKNSGYGRFYKAVGLGFSRKVNVARWRAVGGVACQEQEGCSGLADAEGTEQPNAFSEPSFRLGSEKSGRLSGLQL